MEVVVQFRGPKVIFYHHVDLDSLINELAKSYVHQKKRKHVQSSCQYLSAPNDSLHIRLSPFGVERFFPSNICDFHEKDQLESAKAEMGHVREENQRLKLYLDQIVRDYKTLQMQFHGIVKQAETVTVCKNNSNQGAGERGSDLVSLSLGRAPSSGDSKNKEHEGIIDQNSSPSSQIRGCNADDKKKALEEEDQRLKLGLDCKYEVPSWSNTVESTRPNSSPASSFDEQKKEEPAGTWPPSTATKTTRSSEDEVSLQNDNPAKKARVSIRARCDTPTMNDGCQWRKYGQKIAKGNPCPRAYYRCTVAPSCPVRKQVQRWVEDMSILITTYEGTHNHPLPMAATAMASTTSAAAQMLLSGSSSSSTSGPDRAGPLTAIPNFHGLNMHYLSPEMSRHAGGIGSPFFLHTNSSSSSCPTITLDLTTQSPFNSSSSPHLLTRFNPSTYSSYNPPMLSSAASRSPFSSASSLSFNSAASIPCALPITSWGVNTGNGLIGSAPGIANYPSKNQDIISNRMGSTIYNNSHFQPSSSSSSAASSILNSSNIPLSTQQNMALPETIMAATRAITADPNFQSVLVAALKSIIGGGNGVSPGNPNAGQ